MRQPPALASSNAVTGFPCDDHALSLRRQLVGQAARRLSAHLRTDVVKCDQPKMRRSFMLLLAITVVAGSSPSTAVAVDAAQAVTAASLRVDGDHKTFVVAVRVYRISGYEVEINCVAGCSSPVSYHEPVGDSPLGLFTRDQDGLIFSTWSAGSAYRVRVWRVSDRGIHKVVELSSRGRPDFQSDEFGRSTIRAFEGESSTGPLRPVLWTYRSGSFERGKPHVR